MPGRPAATAAAEDSGAGTDVANGRRIRHRTLLRRTLRTTFIVAAVTLGGYAVWHRWAEVRAGVVALGPWAVALGLLAVIAGLVASMQVWRGLLAAFGSPLPLPTAARVFFVSQLGKYVPGAMWPVLAQMELAREYRVPPRRAATVAVLTMLISLCAGMLTAVATLPFLSSSSTHGYGWAFLAVPVMLIALHPRVANPGLAVVLRVTRRPPLERPLTGRAVVGALAWALVSWVLLGGQVWVLAVRLGASPGRAALLSVGGFAFAWGVGFLAVFAPAGAGVREVLLVATLAPALTVATATVVALASRLLMTVGDLILAGVAAGASRRRTPRGR